MPLTLNFVSAADDAPISVQAEIHGRLGYDGPSQMQSGTTNSVTLDEPEVVEYLVVRPLARNWRVLVGNLGALADPTTIRCPAFAHGDLAAWKAFCGVQGHLSTQGIRIGIIDAGFSDRKAFKRLEFFSEASDADLPSHSHGARVASFIGGDAAGLGLCADPEIYFFDATDESDPEYLSSALIEDGLVFLAQKVGCHLINLSGGLFEPLDLPGLRVASAHAEVCGAVCVAAVGNDSSRPVAQPARFDEVVGVGGIGLDGVAPAESYTALIELIARDQELTGQCGRGCKVFHNVNSSFGVGLDVVAPSIGIPFPLGDGIVTDLEGTSYAAPIVTALLAASLARDETYRRLEGFARSQRARKLLQRMSLDLKLPYDRQGKGSPVWTVAV